MTIRDNGLSGKIGGEPVAVRAPTELIVISGEGSTIPPSMHGKIQDAYNRFLHIKRTSIVPNLIREVRLDDGTRVRIESKFGKDRVMVWPESSEAPQEIWVGGFIFQPRSAMSISPLYWGEPLTEANAPLGTPYGPNSHVLLRARWDKENGRPSGEFRVDRFQSDAYGLVDWQGSDPKEDVLSWDAPPWDSLAISNAGVLSYETASTSIAGSNRYRSRGYSLNRRVFSKQAVVASFVSADGHVDGAAYLRLNGARILLVALRSTTYQAIGGSFTFVAIKDGVRRNIGTYAMGSRETNTQGWYFSTNGRMARCVIIGKNVSNLYYSFALHMDVSGNTFEELSVEVSEVPDTRKVSDNTGAVRIQYKEVVSVTNGGTPGANRSRTESRQLQMTIPEETSAVSSAFAADFNGNIPLVAFIEHRMSKTGVVASGYANNIWPLWTVLSRTPDPTNPSVYDLLTLERTYTSEMNIEWDLPTRLTSVLVKGGAEDRRIELRRFPILPSTNLGSNWIRSTGYGYERYNWSRVDTSTVREIKSTGQWTSLSETIGSNSGWLPEIAAQYQEGQAGKLLDLDLRYGAATVYAQNVDGYAVTPGISRPISGIVVTYDPAQAATSSTTSLHVFRNYTKISEVPLLLWSFAPYPSGSFNYTAWSWSSSYVTDEPRTLLTNQAITSVFDGSGQMTYYSEAAPFSVIGSMKTYYGETLSHVYFQQDSETPIVAYSHLSGKDNDPIVLVQIDDQVQPNLYRIGVY